MWVVYQLDEIFRSFTLSSAGEVNIFACVIRSYKWERICLFSAFTYLCNIIKPEDVRNAQVESIKWIICLSFALLSMNIGLKVLYWENEKRKSTLKTLYVEMILEMATFCSVAQGCIMFFEERNFEVAMVIVGVRVRWKLL